MNPIDPVQRQLEAYNARDLQRFVAEYTDDVRVYRPPNPEPVLAGREAFGRHYAANRFNLPDLHADVVNRMVIGNKVVDHERIRGLGPEIVEAIAVYEVSRDKISAVWFFSG
jgi:hypothetical protein